MKIERRRFLQLASAAALPAIASAAWAQSYPSRPVRLVAPFPAGGVLDLFARLEAQWLSERLGQPFNVENRAGAGGNIGTEVVVKAPPDGHTLLQVSVVNAWNATLYDNLNFNFIRDIIPVASFYRGIGVLVVHPSFPPRTVPELIAYAKANPGKVSMASGGVGSAQHVYGELFKMMARLDMVHVPYRGGAPALIDLLGGQVPLMFDSLPTSMEHLRSGKLRALAITAAGRLDRLPDIPTVAEFLPGYEGSSWQGIGVPRGTPAEIIDTLNTGINAALADPGIKARITDLGGTPMGGSPADFAKLIAEETEKWAKVVKFAGTRAE